MANSRRINPSAIEIADGVAYVHLTRGYVALIDEEDIPLIKQYTWFIVKKQGQRVIYAKTKDENNKTIAMQNVIMALKGLTTKIITV